MAPPVFKKRINSLKKKPEIGKSDDVEKKNAQEEKDKAQIQKSVYKFPKHWTSNSRGAQCNVDLLIDLWKILHADIKERLWFVFHLSTFHTYKNVPHHDWISTDLIWIMRHVFIETDVNDLDGERRLRRAFDAMEQIVCVVENNANGQTEMKWFGEIGLSASIRSKTGENSSHGGNRSTADMRKKREGVQLKLWSRNFCSNILKSAQGICRFWMGARNGDEALRCLSFSVPKLNEKDRRMISDVSEKSVDRREMDFKSKNYLQRLCETVGKKKFEKLCFGRLKVCGTCGSTNRQKYLLCCKRCEIEEIRPKKRYCDTKCQRVDWPNHRQFHLEYKKYT